METRENRIARLVEPGIIAIIRAPNAAVVLPAARALLEGGVLAIEVTMTTPQALNAIRDVQQALGDRALVGVGTVLEVETCQAAIKAGARFVVSPICRLELVPVAHAAQCPIMLGAYTPTEAQLAYEAGSDFVKLFPADGLGPAYIKGLRAPLPHLRLVPTGGVDLSTLGAFVQAGCPAVGVGSSLVSAPILRAQDWSGLAQLAARFVAAMRAARQSA
ncbi:MAG: bifunctional 4-hydroxy-2-oxoglutarate aldolase/2-dehydro-3-deoxy-phosphogluconate aldolase [Verrucomicrobia bacterium]|nr:bifunctional 4-hydroxy-2-oxoglutarate aldolase/2-dehydro-3-deoxy-phosphogluconate aldolase [Verrucomicrobiota bacterium]